MSIKEHPPHRVHIPVLLDATLAVMQPVEGENYLDLTAGYGGHASVFLKHTGNYAHSVLVDRDRHTAPYLKDLVSKGAKLLHDDFLNAARQLVEEGKKFDLILADLGVSSPQLDRAERGFSFSKEGPIDMRMDQMNEKSAEQIVNLYNESDLVDIIVRYGEEPKSIARRIARAIVASRPFRTTKELADAIEYVSRGPRKRIHPATRTFQALRIEVNDELKQVENVLPLLPKLLKPKGRVGVISFHSLEDRIVKRYFSEQVADGYEAEFTVLTKKPILGTDDVHNPRSRSAKLRVAVKK
jgi:16S rRNA (cytosine1402-N4)-methyltransferase